MAKGQVTEEDLMKGLQGVGSISGLSTRKSRRDSPFRDTSQPEPTPQSHVEPRIQSKPKTAIPLATPPSAPLVESHIGAAGLPATSAQQVTISPVHNNVTEVRTIEHPTFNPLNRPQPSNGLRKVDIYAERISLQIGSEMKEGCERLAKMLQKLRTDKSERITSNTVMRCFIQAGLETFDLVPGEFANTEEELLQLALSKFCNQTNTRNQ